MEGEGCGDVTGDDENGNVRGSVRGKPIPLMDSLPSWLTGRLASRVVNRSVASGCRIVSCFR